MATFVMKGYKGKTYARRISTSKLEIRGRFHIQGVAPVNDNGGVPEWIDSYFELNKGVDTIAISGEKGSVVYSRTSG